MLLHPYLNYKLPDECNNTGCNLLRIREICSFITQVNGKSFLAALIQLFRHSGIRDRQAGVETVTHGKSCGSGIVFATCKRLYKEVVVVLKLVF